MPMRDRRGSLLETSEIIRGESLGNPAAAGVAIHAGIPANDAANSFTVGITQPDVARAVDVAFGAAWDGGDVTIFGTNSSEGGVSQIYASNPGGSRVGVVAFQTITRITKGGVGSVADAATFATTDVFGLSRLLGVAVGLVAQDGASEVGTWDSVNNTVAPTTAADASIVFTVMYPSGGPS